MTTNDRSLDEIYDRILYELGRRHPELSVADDILLKKRLLEVTRARVDDPDDLERLFKEAMDGV